MNIQINIQTGKNIFLIGTILLSFIIAIVGYTHTTFAQTYCTKKDIGNADCLANNAGVAVDILDYAILYSELIKGCSSTNLAVCGTDVDHDGNVMDANFNYPGTNYIATDNKVDAFDYAVWIQGFLLENQLHNSTSPTVTPVTSITTLPKPTTPVTVLPSISPVTGGKGIWISADELAKLPTSGAAWDRLSADAQNSVSNPDFVDQNSKNDVYTLAKALVYARTGNTTYRTQVRDALKLLVSKHPISSSSKWDWLGILRGLGSYAIAADLIDLKSFDPTFDSSTFRPWLRDVRSAVVEGGRGSVISAQENRPNNFGSHASASRAAADLYLMGSSDTTLANSAKTDLDRAAKVFKGYLGDRTSYTGFTFGDLSWQCSSSAPVGINPKGCTKNGHNIDGVIPDDMRRVMDVDSSCGNMKWPPCKNSNTNYVWEGLQGVTVAAELFYRAGYDAYNWQDKAVLRAVNWMYTTNFSDGKPYPAQDDDAWIVYIINKRYGTSFAPGSTPTAGKMVGYADWTHQ